MQNDSAALPLISPCHVENPLDPATWSRTPFNIAEELKRRGRLGPALSGRKKTALDLKLRAALSMLRFGPHRRPRLLWVAPAVRAAQAAFIEKQIEKTGATDVLHFSGDYYLPLRRKLPGVRHYLLIDATWRDWRHSRLRKGLDREVDREFGVAYRQMDHLFPIAQFVRDSLIEHYGVHPSRITVVGTGRGAIEPFQGEKDYDNATTLFVGKVRWVQKGGLLLRDAFHIVRRRNPRAKLWAVVEPTVAEQLRGEPNVEVFSSLPLPQLQDLFNRASLYAMPALEEPWGLVYLEALSCKTPILGLRRKAFPELSGNGEYGFIVNGDSEEAVANAWVDALSDPNRLRRMGEAGQGWAVENFTWQKVVDRILDVVDRNAAVRMQSGAVVP